MSAAGGAMRTGSLMVIGFLVCLLAGCAAGLFRFQDGYSPPDGSRELQPCATVETIRAADLSDAVIDCDREGWSVVFPDGGKADISAYGHTSSSSQTDRDLRTSGTYSTVNVGTAGVIAAHRKPDGTAEWWGPADLLEDWWAQMGREAPRLNSLGK
jgi:hypothetical protein